jgi:hypothetical protein
MKKPTASNSFDNLSSNSQSFSVAQLYHFHFPQFLSPNKSI